MAINNTQTQNKGRIWSKRISRIAQKNAPRSQPFSLDLSGLDHPTASKKRSGSRASNHTIVAQKPSDYFSGKHHPHPHQLPKTQNKGSSGPIASAGSHTKRTKITTIFSWPKWTLSPHSTKEKVKITGFKTHHCQAKNPVTKTKAQNLETPSYQRDFLRGNPSLR